MAAVALVSILTLDRVGLVSAIADCLFTARVNLRDTSFAVLGKGAEFTSVCELPDDVSAEALLDDLELVPELEGAQIRVVPYGFDAQPGPDGRHHPSHRSERRRSTRPHRAACRDLRPERCQHRQARCAEAVGDGRRPLRHALFRVAAARAGALCLAAVANTAGTLGLTSRVEAFA